MDSDKDLGLIRRAQRLLQPGEPMSKLGFLVPVEIDEKL